MSLRHSWSRLWCAAAFAVIMNHSANYSVHAQDFPTKPVTFITPAAAGNSPTW